MSTFTDSYTSCITALESQELVKSFRLLRNLIQETGDWSLVQDLENITRNYTLLLEYFQKGMNDPKRKELHTGFIKQCLTLADKAKNAYQSSHSLSEYAARLKKYRGDWNLQEILEQAIRLQRQTLFLRMSQDETSLEAEKKYEEALEELFHQVWTSPLWEESVAEYARKHLFSPDTDKEIKLVLLSATTLGTLYLFDENKISVLVKAYKHEDTEIRERAFIGLVLTMMVFGNRMKFYPTLHNSILSLRKDTSFTEDLRSLQILLLNIENTPNIRKKITEEILPSIYNSQLHNINIEEYINEDEQEDEQETDPVIKNLKSRIQDLYEMQKDNIDMSYFTFSHLKSFPFFLKTSNWFLPFRPDRSEVEAFLPSLEPLVSIVSKSQNLCDSDLYSLCFFLHTLPAPAKESITSNIKIQLGEKDLSNVFVGEERQSRITTQKKYLENCVRYFQLFGNKNDFVNPFHLDKLLFSYPFIAELIQDETILTHAAVYAHKHNMHQAVIRIYGFIDQNFTLKLEDFQLYGFHLQKSRNYEKAILCYEKASIIDPGSAWTLYHLGICYIKTGKIQKAVPIFTQLTHNFPENRSYIWHYGECLYLQGKYRKAISQFKKLEYLEEDSVRAIQAIAYCSLMDFDIEHSNLYYTRLSSLRMTQEDYRNAGHAAWCSGNLSRAIELYRKACGKEYFLFSGKERFLLETHGIETDDLLIMQDIVNSEE